MDEANANARHAINDGKIDGLIVVGGDGIAHLGVNIACDTGIPLGIIAAGTGNDLARSIGMPEGDVVAGTHAVLDKLDSPRKVDAIKAQCVAQDFSFVAQQRGMFSYTGLTAAQVERMKEEFGIYAVSTGRICLAALNTKNVDYVAKAIAAVTKG